MFLFDYRREHKEFLKIFVLFAVILCFSVLSEMGDIR
jgi:hypothetical protein